MSDNPFIQPTYIVSTSHIDPETATALNNAALNYTQGCFGIMDILTYQFGYILFTRAISIAQDNGNLIPQCILDIMKCASLEDCNIICLDHDAEVDDRLQTWEW